MAERYNDLLYPIRVECLNFFSMTVSLLETSYTCLTDFCKALNSKNSMLLELVCKRPSEKKYSSQMFWY